MNDIKTASDFYIGEHPVEASSIDVKTSLLKFHAFWIGFPDCRFSVRSRWSNFEAATQGRRATAEVLPRPAVGWPATAIEVELGSGQEQYSQSTIA